LKYFEPTISSK